MKVFLFHCGGGKTYQQDHLTFLANAEIAVVIKDEQMAKGYCNDKIQRYTHPLILYRMFSD